MVIIIPDNIDGLKKVEESIEKVNFFRDCQPRISRRFSSRFCKFFRKKNVAKEPVESEFELYLPKFKIETSIDLTELLKQVN